MNARRYPGRSSVAGFTLVEALVATALMGLVLTGLAMVTSQWMPNWNRGFARVQRSELVALAMDRLVSDLAAAEFVPANREAEKPLFEGLESSVTFVRSALGPNDRPGLQIVQLAEMADRKGPSLSRSTTLFTPRSPGTGPLVFGESVEVLRSPFRVSFSYAGRDGQWRGDWLEEDELPRAVRLVVRDSVTGQTLGASTATVIRNELPVQCVTDKTRSGCGTDRPTGKRTDGNAAGETQ